MDASDVRPGPVERDLRTLAGALTAGVAVGFVINGLGVRGAMRLLFLLNPQVRGRLSDDGFVMGRFTLRDTATLVAFSTVVGVMGAVVALVVRQLRFGPAWFSWTALAVGPAVVVGDMLVHSDGIDFRVLEPTGLAIGLFVLLPGLSAVVTLWLVDRWAAPDAWPYAGSRWRLAGLLTLVPLWPLLGPVGAALGVRAWSRRMDVGTVARVTRVSRIVAQVALVAVFARSATGLATTIAELYA